MVRARLLRRSNPELPHRRSRTRRVRERRLCFGDLQLDGEAPGGLSWALLNLSVTVRAAGSGDDFVPACNDALRVRFWSHAALFAPRRVASLPRPRSAASERGAALTRRRTAGTG